jgi:hypothetical protein
MHPYTRSLSVGYVKALEEVSVSPPQVVCQIKPSSMDFSITTEIVPSDGTSKGDFFVPDIGIKDGSLYASTHQSGPRPI